MEEEILNTQKQIKEDVENARRDLDIFKDVEDNIQIQRLFDVAEAQIKWRTADLIKSPECTLQREGTSSDFLKGQIEGIRLMLAIPAIAIQQAKETIDKYEDANENQELEE